MQVANEMALIEVDREFFGQRLSLAVVTFSDEESGNDMLARLRATCKKGRPRPPC